ncbi:hypothetical protein CDAR_51391 [Caerostris darwini]|uniref:Uncharacterized protein n=1 Tax=Caerostris darwini TaxID=1538125 RepID=A0AAV4U646_9ARAC|nr:hypothetical protein CDAR_51391 [Caerostris darwini]
MQTIRNSTLSLHAHQTISSQCSNRYPLDTMAIRASNLAYKSFPSSSLPSGFPLSPSLKALSDDPFLPDNGSAGVRAGVVEDEPIRGFKGGITRGTIPVRERWDFASPGQTSIVRHSWLVKRKSSGKFQSPSGSFVGLCRIP